MPKLTLVAQSNLHENVVKWILLFLLFFPQFASSHNNYGRKNRQYRDFETKLIINSKSTIILGSSSSVFL